VRVLDDLNRARYARPPERREGGESTSNVHGTVNRSGDETTPETPATDTYGKREHDAG